VLEVGGDEASDALVYAHCAAQTGPGGGGGGGSVTLMAANPSRPAAATAP
jgi:hypothetical protein